MSATARGTWKLFELFRPSAAWGALWQAATTLREHCGDGHNTVGLNATET